MQAEELCVVNIQFKKGVLELCVLAVLSDEDLYGYKIVQTISENINISGGTIYPLLRRLSKEGFFETYLEESEDGPPRKYYHLTEKGHKTKDALIKEWDEFVNAVQRILDKKEREEVLYE